MSHSRCCVRCGHDLDAHSEDRQRQVETGCTAVGCGCPGFTLFSDSLTTMELATALARLAVADLEESA